MTDTIQRLRRGGYKIRTKEQWGSKQLPLYGWRLRTKPVDFPVDYGFVHISVTHTHGDEGMRDIEEIGVDRFGTGVSYNWVIDHKTDHTIYIGQPLAAKGAHTVNDKNVKGFPNNLNYFGHAVAFMGDVNDTVCDECVDTIAAIFASEKLEGVMRIGDNIYPHRKFAAKSCPGDKLYDRMRDISDLVARKVRAGDVCAGRPAAKKAAVKKPAKKPAPKKADKPSRVELARDLLEDAKKAAKSPQRVKKIEAGLNDLPEE